MTAKNSSGKWGEIFAADYLKEHGYTILQRNYRCRTAEIDIVALCGGVLCFIEVKTRKNSEYGHAYDAVNFAKRQKLILGARSYLAQCKKEYDVRFDIVEVYGQLLPAGFCVDKINVIENAFDV